MRALKFSLSPLRMPFRHARARLPDSMIGHVARFYTPVSWSAGSAETGVFHATSVKLASFDFLFFGRITLIVPPFSAATCKLTRPEILLDNHGFSIVRALSLLCAYRDRAAEISPESLDLLANLRLSWERFQGTENVRPARDCTGARASRSSCRKSRRPKPTCSIRPELE